MIKFLYVQLVNVFKQKINCKKLFKQKQKYNLISK